MHDDDLRDPADDLWDPADDLWDLADDLWDPADYLWDPAASAGAEPTIVALERALAPLRYEAEPVRLPLREPSARPRPSRWSWALSLGAAAAAVALALVLTPKESASVVVTVLRAVPEPEPPAAEVPEPPAAEVPEPPAAEVVASPVEVPVPEPVVKPPRAKRSRPPAKPPKPEPNPDASAPQVECILGPSKCKPVGPSLPATPTTTQIREAVAVVKEQAKACGPRHGATAGTKVKVKFAVSGETGRVLVAEAMPPFGGTPLGNCVAAALAKAQFPKFQNESLGVVYPILVDGT